MEKMALAGRFMTEEEEKYVATVGTGERVDFAGGFGIFGARQDYRGGSPADSDNAIRQ